MGSATLLLFASGLGVVFGWQPMPDGSPRYEYVVQLEPELVATLKPGQSIPITSDVPEQVDRIGRIRIVVGTGDLPRQKLPIQSRSTADTTGKLPLDGVVLTQHTISPPRTSDDGRYPALPPKSQILPPGSENASRSDPFAASRQRNAQQALSNHTTSSGQILPPADGSRQPLVRSRAAAGEGSILNTTDNRTLSTGDRIAPAYDNRLGDNRLGGNSILPPASRDNPTTSATSPESQDHWQQGERSTRLASPTQPLDDPTPNPTSQPGLFNAPWPPIVNHNERRPVPTSTNTGSVANSYPVQSTPPSTPANAWPNEQTRDLFDVENHPQNYPPRIATSTPPPEETHRQDQPMGPAFPATDTKWPMQPPATPEIRRDMVRGEMAEQPSTADIYGAVPQPVAAAVPHTQTTERPTGNPQQPAGRWPIDTPQAAPQIQNTAATTGPTSTFPLVLSWVLLTSSGVGNFFLFWNYLDVRSKYRGLAYSTRRNGADRYSHYED